MGDEEKQGEGGLAAGAEEGGEVWEGGRCSNGAATEGTYVLYPIMCTFPLSFLIIIIIIIVISSRGRT